jgi:hypothetical protein
MGIGRIASFLSSLSPASDAAAATPSAGAPIADRHIETATPQQDYERTGSPGGASDIAWQLQTMIASVRSSHEVAVEQGAAMAVSSAGTQLKNAVTALGHIFAVVDAEAMAQGAAAQVREADQVIDAVEAGLVGAQSNAAQIISTLPAQQAAAARQAGDQFQADMRQALSRVRSALGTLMR